MQNVRMSRIIKIKKGFNINLVGKAEEKVGEFSQPETFAVKPTDFVGMQRPKIVVKEGDTVRAGTSIFFDTRMPDIQYCAPVSGEIVQVKRGERRKILEIKILADRQIEFEQFPIFSISDLQGLSREAAQNIMTKSGVWPNILQRPYGIVANPMDVPKAIHISTFDTHPLAPNLYFTFKEDHRLFQAGVDILDKFTKGKVHVNINADSEVSHVFSRIKNAQINKFSGVHPAGCVGIHIHHVDPINKGELVWTISPYGVIQIGKLFLEGKYDASKLVAVTGSEILKARYYPTYSGACVNKAIQNNLVQHHVRVISGNVLTGDAIGKEGYLGFYHQQISVIPEGNQYELLGWILPTIKKLSFHRALGLLSFLAPNKKYRLSTNIRGQSRAFVQSGEFERVLPMDIFPTYLFKAILAEDIDQMEGLGIYEVVEEDIALCEFIDVSKHELQKMLRNGLELMQNS